MQAEIAYAVEAITIPPKIIAFGNDFYGFRAM
jgi:hypothetical protein